MRVKTAKVFGMTGEKFQRVKVADRFFVHQKTIDLRIDIILLKLTDFLMILISKNVGFKSAFSKFED